MQMYVGIPVTNSWCQLLDSGGHLTTSLNQNKISTTQRKAVQKHGDTLLFWKFSFFFKKKKKAFKKNLYPKMSRCWIIGQNRTAILQFPTSRKCMRFSKSCLSLCYVDNKLNLPKNRDICSSLYSWGNWSLEREAKPPATGTQPASRAMLTVPLAASPSCCYKPLSELHILVLKVLPMSSIASLWGYIPWEVLKHSQGNISKDKALKAA